MLVSELRAKLELIPADYEVVVGLGLPAPALMEQDFQPSERSPNMARIFSLAEPNEINKTIGLEL